MRAKVIGIGQPAAGDDGVGGAVLDALRRLPLPSGVELSDARDPSAIIDLIEPSTPVVIVDAVLGAPAGEVLSLGVEELAARASRRVSSHGLSVPEAVALARTLGGEGSVAPLHIVAVTIDRPLGYRRGLSPEVAAAVPRAVERVLQWLEGERGDGSGREDHRA